MSTNNNNELDDIIINKDVNPNNNTKNFLTITGLALVAVVISIILLQVLTKNKMEQTKANETNDTIIVSSELKLEKNETVDKKESIKEVPLLEPIDESPFDDDFEEEEKIETIPIVVTQNKKSEVEPTPPKKVEKKPIVHQPKPKPVAPKIVTEKRYFVQVGSYRETPSSRFLSKIKNNGFNYLITAPNSNGIKRLLIGPYSSRENAKDALSKVHDRINKSAYVIKR